MNFSSDWALCRISFTILAVVQRKKVHHSTPEATVKLQTEVAVCPHSIQDSQQCDSSSASTLVVGIGREAKLGDHQVGEAEWHEAIDLCQPVQTVGPLKKVFRTMPHTLISTAGILFQVAEVHGFDKDPRRSGRAATGLGVFPQIQRYSKVHCNIITILCCIHQLMHCLRLVLKKLEVAAVEEGSAN